MKVIKLSEDILVQDRMKIQWFSADGQEYGLCIRDDGNRYLVNCENIPLHLDNEYYKLFNTLLNYMERELEIQKYLINGIEKVIYNGKNRKLISLSKKVSDSTTTFIGQFIVPTRIKKVNIIPYLIEEGKI